MASGYQFFTHGEERYPYFVRQLHEAPAYLRELAGVDDNANLVLTTTELEPELRFDGPAVDVCGMFATVLRAVLRPARNKYTPKLLVMHNNRRLNFTKLRSYVLRINNIEYGVPNTVAYFLHVIFTLVSLGEPWDTTTRWRMHKTVWLDVQRALISAAAAATETLDHIRTLEDAHQNGSVRAMPTTMLWSILHAIDAFVATVFELVRSVEAGDVVQNHTCSRCHTELDEAPTFRVTLGVNELLTRSFVSCHVCKKTHVPISKLVTYAPGAKRKRTDASAPDRPRKRSYKDVLRAAQKRAAALDSITLPE